MVNIHHSVEKNDAGGAKLGVDKNSCTLNDLEVAERGIDRISTVDEFGLGEPHIEKEMYVDEAYIIYYYCTNCSRSFSVMDQMGNDPALAWEEAKEHLNGTS